MTHVAALDISAQYVSITLISCNVFQAPQAKRFYSKDENLKRIDSEHNEILDKLYETNVFTNSKDKRGTLKYFSFNVPYSQILFF